MGRAVGVVVDQVAGMAVVHDGVDDDGRRMAAVVQHVRQVRADHVGDSEREGVDAVVGIGLEHPGLVDAVIVLVEAHAALYVPCTSSSWMSGAETGLM